MTNRARTRTRSLGDRLRAATAGCGDIETLSQVVFDTVAGDVPFEFACLATTDPVTGLINAAYKSGPLPIGDQEFAAVEYGAPDLNKFAEIAERPEPVGVLSVDTAGRVTDCVRMRDYMIPFFGFSDEIRLVCRSPRTVWGALAIYRGAGEPTFTSDDGAAMVQVHEIIADGIRRVLFLDRPAASHGTVSPVVIIVDPDDRVVDQSIATDTVIAELGGWDHGALPACLCMVAASARTRTTPTQTQVQTRSGGWLKVRGLPLAGDATRTIVLTVEPSDPAAVGQLAISARGLTAREEEIVALVLQGLSTKDIAVSLFLSPYTVQDHLKAVFDKLGISSRRELIGQFALTSS